jgi:hypothetical protein
MEFVNKQLSLKLKEKGFDKPCFGYYYIKTPTGMNEGELVLNRYPYRNVTYEDTLKKHIGFINPNMVDAPTIEQVLKWLGEEKDFMVFPVYSKNTSRWYCEIVNADSLESEKLPLSDSYEDAAIAGIEYVIKNLI